MSQALSKNGPQEGRQKEGGEARKDQKKQLKMTGLALPTKDYNKANKKES